jgi:uncharacterized RDD family membrane protein YckC
MSAHAVTIGLNDGDRKENQMNYPYVKASPQHRLAGLALDAVLVLVTFYIGYIVWALIIWGQGQTPGKQILRMRVYAQETSKPATWAHMAIRQFLIPLTIGLAGLVPLFLVGGIGASLDPDLTDATAVLIVLLYFATLVFQLVDAFWILKGDERRRITDIWAKTDVLNECVENKLEFANGAVNQSSP